MNALTLNIPNDRDAEAARSALEAMRNVMKLTQERLVRLRASEGDGDVEVAIPAEAFHLLVRVLTHMANGDAVSVVPVHAELTTQQAAELLNVSRPHVIKLLDQGDIPHRKVGSHRRVALTDLLAYRDKDQARRKGLLDELTREAQELGLGY